MKKEQQLLAIVGLLLATIVVLSVAYARHYKWDENDLADNSQIETEIEADTIIYPSCYITGKNIIHSCISELSIESEMMPICILTIELAILRIIKKLNIL